MQRLRAGDDVRTAKVRDIRRRIRQGTYESSFKLSIAVDRLLERLFE
ncbi:MAG: flagellar biosynthesis anti-sigma factor FlgM [Tepidisphaerales bacterium]